MHLVEPNARARRLLRAWLVAAFAVSIVDVPRGAWGAEPSPTPQPADESSSSASPAPSGSASSEPSATQRAEQLANKAYDLHQQGKYADAIATYLRAYELSRAGVILLNVATIYDRKLHERALASEYYRRYLGAQDAEPALVLKATERLETLKREAQAEQKRADAAVIQPAATSSPASSARETGLPAGPVFEAEKEPPRSVGWRIAGAVVGATGVVSLGVSAGLGWLAKSRNDDANAVCNGSACATQRGVTLAHDAGTFATASTVAFVAGLTLVGTGAALYFLAPRHAHSSSGTMAVAPQFAPSRAGLTLNGSF